MPHDQEAVEQTKRDCRDDEEIHRRDAVGVITEKCFPTLGRRPSTRGHILSYAGLADIDAELEKLAVDTRRAPEWIGDAYLAEVSGFTIASVSQMFGNNRQRPTNAKRSKTRNETL